MLLQRLSEYADRIPSTPTLYNETVIRYVVVLDAKGQQPPTLVSTENPASRSEKRGRRRLAPQITRSVGIQPLLLADNAEYTFGLARETSKPERVSQCHTAYLDLLDRCAADTGAPEVQAVQTFLHDDPMSKLTLPDDYDRGALVTFRVDGAWVTDLSTVQAFWAREHDPSAAEGGTRIMQCIVCGNERPVLERMQGKVKGIPGGQMAGTSLISANAEAFESYGLEASLVSPTCAACGERFTKGINALLADERRCIRLGESAFIFWTRENVDILPPRMVSNPDVKTIHDLLYSPLSGNELLRFRDTPFYAVSLTASGGRAVVRDWIDTTLGNAWENTARWFRWQEIVGSDGAMSDPIPLYTLAAATVREVRDLPKGTPRAMFHTALTGQPLPRGLLAQTIRRSHAEQRVTRPRAALIKLALMSERYITEGTMVQLEPDYAHPTEDQSSAAYHCGRLLAILENAQDAAIPGVKAGIVDRFYGTASTAPVSVFSRLLRGVQPHLAKLDRDKHGIYVNIQRDLTEVLGRLSVERDPRTGQLSGFPRTLTLEQQGLFSLGYYHQRAKRFSRTARVEEQMPGDSDDV
jgi:CRISPR-associated protein Csd1